MDEVADETSHPATLALDTSHAAALPLETSHFAAVAPSGIKTPDWLLLELLDDDELDDETDDAD